MDLEYSVCQPPIISTTAKLSRTPPKVGRNICHGSDGVDSAEKEIALWFTPEELVEWDQAGAEEWIYKAN